MIYPDSFEQKTGFDIVRKRIAELCVSADAAGNVDSMTFINDYNRIITLLEETREMTVINQSADKLDIFQLGNINQSLSRLRIAGTFLAPAELLDIRRVLHASDNTVAFFNRHNSPESDSVRCPALAAVAESLVSMPAALRAIDNVIDRYGNVKDSASPELGQIRRELSSVSGRINSIMRRVVSKAVADGYLDADTNPTVRDGRLVLPVQPMHKRHISGIVHDESASGKTYFIEPAEIVEANNRVRELQIEERREITRILTELANQLRPSVSDILRNYQILNRLDFIHAKALYAIETNAGMPSIAEKPEIEWYHAIHPVLQHSLRRQGKDMVALDIELTEENRILIISGPNAGGKSVCLKTVGIVQYMMQCGLLPPVYENSRMGIFDDIFIDIGDDQSIEDDLSTYSSHLRNMKNFLQKGRPTSIILIDEFGGGTEPQIGGAIAQAILRQFNNKNMWGVITTHYQNLKHFAEETPGLVNGSMLYDRHLMQPMFKLSIGNPGSSFALEIARKTGLPQDIIDDATEIVGSDYVNLDKYLLDITRDKRYWENKRADIRRKEKQLEEIIQRYQNDADSLSRQRKEIIAEARDRARQILDASNASIERTIHDIRKVQAEKEATLQARLKLQQEKEELSRDNAVDEHPMLRKAVSKKKKNKQPAPQPVKDKKTLSVGDNVKLDGEGTPGEILEINGKNALVSFGMLKTTVALDRLYPTMAKPPTGAKKSTFISVSTSESSRNRQLNFKPEIDVRGMRADEAVQAVTYFIDDAIQFGAGRVRILHGTGTGALRQFIRAYLQTVPDVTAFHDEDVRFGGAGITVVTLR